MLVDLEELKQVNNVYGDILSEYAQLEARMLVSALNLEVLVKQTNMSELADQLSFKDQLNSLEKILTLLEKDNTPTSRWNALVNKEALSGG